MNTRKKLIFLMVAVLVVAMLAACAPRREEPAPEQPAAEEPDVEQPVAEEPEAPEAPEAPVQRTYTMFYGMGGRDPVPLSETTIGRLITEKTGVTLDIEYVVGGDVATRVGVMIASGDFPDIIWGHTYHYRFMEAGALLPIQDLITDKPNIMEAYGHLIDISRMGPDRNMYFLTPYREEGGIDHASIGFWLHKELVRDLGFPRITDIDEYFDVIRNYVAANPEFNGAPTIGFTFPAESWRFFEVTNPPMFLAGYPNDGGVLVERGDAPEDFIARTYATGESARNFYSKLNQIWNEGLLDREVFVQTHDQFLEKVSSGRVVGMTAQRWQFAGAPMQALEDQGFPDRRFVPFQILNEGVERGQYMNAALPIARDGLAISRTAADPEGIVQFFEDFLSEEVQKLYYWGIEGLHYNVGADGLFYRTQEQRDLRANPEHVRTYGTDWWGFPRRIHPFSDGNKLPGLTISEVTAAFDESELAILEGFGVETFAQLLPEPIPSPYGFAWDVILPEGSPAHLAHTRMNDLSRHYYPLLIMAPNVAEFDRLWDEFVAEFEEIGIQEYEAFMTSALQERVRNWGLLD